MTLAEFARALRERWLLLVAGLLVGLVVGGAAALLLPRKYDATVSMYVTAQSPSGNPQSAYEGSLLSEQKIASYIQLVSDDRLGDDVMARLHETGDPKAITDELAATSEPNTALLTLTAIDRDPRRAAVVANAAASSLSSLVAEIEQPADRTQPPTVIARIVRAAVPPRTYASPNAAIDLGVGALAGLLVAAGVLVTRKALDTSVTTAARLREVAGAPVLGELIAERDIAEHAQIVVHRSGTPDVEALRQLRTNLRFVDVDTARRAYVVTSSVPGEGKTTVAATLAVVLVQGGASVVVVESDLRRPRLGAYLGVEQSVGLTTVLTGAARLGDALQRSVTGVDVLTSGQVPPNPSEMLSSRHMGEVIETLRESYDVVLLDSPPLLPVTDGAILARACDGALLCCQHGSTTSNQLEAAVTGLHAVGARLVGTILTKIPPAARGGYGTYSALSPPEQADPARHDGQPAPAPRPKAPRDAAGSVGSDFGGSGFGSSAAPGERPT